jgi:hypothetical protein
MTAAAMASAATPATIVLEIELRMFHLRNPAFASRRDRTTTASSIGNRLTLELHSPSALRSQFDKIAAVGRQTAFSFTFA